MPVRVERFGDVATFRDAVFPFLILHERVNSLPLGLLALLDRDPRHYGDTRLYLAVAWEEDDVVGAALMTPPHNVVIAAATLMPASEAIARDLLDAPVKPPGALGPGDVVGGFVAAWNKFTGASPRVTRNERLYSLEAVQPFTSPEGGVRRGRPEDRPLLVDWQHAFELEALGVDNREQSERTVVSMLESPPDIRGVFLWEDGDGEDVSYAGYTRPTPNGMAVAPVYTPPRFRGRGYATGCTAAVSQYLLDSGRKFCVLFTDLANPTSNKIYQSVGYRPICDFTEITFEVA